MGKASAPPFGGCNVSELADIAHLLSGGELVLTTGVALPDEPTRLEHYVTDLAQVGASGLCIERAAATPSSYQTRWWAPPAAADYH